MMGTRKRAQRVQKMTTMDTSAMQRIIRGVNISRKQAEALEINRVSRTRAPKEEGSFLTEISANCRHSRDSRGNLVANYYVLNATAIVHSRDEVEKGIFTITCTISRFFSSNRDHRHACESVTRKKARRSSRRRRFAVARTPNRRKAKRNDPKSRKNKKSNQIAQKKAAKYF